MPADQTTWSPEEVLPILRRASLFEGLSDPDLARVAEIARSTAKESGEILFHQGDPGDAYYVVVDGSVEEFVRGEGEAGEERLSVQAAGGGVGALALIDDTPRSTGARALEPSRLIVIEREDIRSLLGTDSLATRLLDLLSEAIRGSDQRSGGGQPRDRQAGDPMEFSRTIQQGLLPRNAPKVEGYDIAAGTSLEDDGEGRTIWDRIDLPDGRTALVSLLVRGGGVLPSHHLGVVRALLRDAGGAESRLTEIFRRTNEAMVGAAVDRVEQHVDCAILVPSGRAIEWAAAGRPSGAILRRDGNFEELASHGPPLGVMEGFRYGSHEAEMGSGDVALVLSDASKGLFRGAADLVATLQGKPVGEVVSTVHKALRKAQDQVPETTVLYARRQ